MYDHETSTRNSMHMYVPCTPICENKCIADRFKMCTIDAATINLYKAEKPLGEQHFTVLFDFRGCDSPSDSTGWFPIILIQQQVRHLRVRICHLSLTVHLRHTFDQFVRYLGIEPVTLMLLVQGVPTELQ